MLPFYVDDAIFTYSGGAMNFDSNLFQQINQPTGTTTPVNGFISDYVSFDLSGIADANKPTLSTGVVANRVYFSGDNYAISPAGTSGDFEALTLDPADPVKGSFGPPGTLPSGGGTLSHGGTYSLVKANPVDLTGTLRITALQGIWRDYTTVLSGLSNFFVITLPSSNDNQYQEILFVTRNGSTVTNLYFGYVDYSAMTFRAYPVKDLVTAAIDGELTGTISSLTNSSGVSTNLPSSVRFGNFQFNAGQTLPSGFSNSGKFTVFRR
jgi:hypothetical protein